MKLFGIRGQRIIPEVQESPIRLGAMGDILANLSGEFAELAERGLLFHGQTAVAGVAPGTAIGTTAAHALANPRGSDVDLILLLTTMALVSGTLGLGQVDYVAHDDPTQAEITGTAIVIVNGKLDGPKARGKLLTTATVPTAGKQFRCLCSVPPIVGTTAVAPWRTEDYVGGAIQIPPGCAVSWQETGAGGSSPVVRFGNMWLERPHK